MQIFFRRVKLQKLSKFIPTSFIFQQRIFFDVPFVKSKVELNILTVAMNQFTIRGLITTPEETERK